MAGRLVGALAAASALGAQAFLLPAEMHHSEDRVSPFSVQPVQQAWQAVELPCSECVLPSPKTEIKDEAEGDLPMFIQGGANSLVVNITTLEDGHAIGLASQHTIYPPLEAIENAMEAMVDITPSSSNRRQSVKVSGESVVLSEEVVSPEGEVLIQMIYRIDAVDNHPVNVEPIRIIAIKDSNEQISLVDVSTVTAGPPVHDFRPAPEHGMPHRRPAPPKPCAWPSFICQLRDFVEAKMSGMGHRLAHGGCRGKALKGHLRGPRPHHFGDDKEMADRPHHHHHHKGEHSKDEHPKHPHHHHKEGDREEVEHHKHPHHHHKEGEHGKDEHAHAKHPHPKGGKPCKYGKHGKGGLKEHKRPHHHHHHKSKLHHGVRNILMILTPIFLGITVGMAVSVLGMLVGRLISYMWITFVRGGQRGYASVQLSEEAAEKAEIEELPPVYEEKVVAVYTDEKKDSE